MIRLCLNRIVNNQATPLSMCLRPLVVPRYSSSSTQPQMTCMSQSCKSLNPSIQLSARLQTSRTMSTLTSENVDTSMTETVSARNIMSRLDKAFGRFEEICQGTERVTEANFARTFDVFTKNVEKLEAANLMNEDVKSNLAVMAAILLRCCGNLMFDTPEKGRELLACNLWQYIKEKNIPLDMSHYNGLIRIMNENNTSFDPQKILEEIANANLTPDRVTYQRLIHQYCIQGDIKGATSSLEKMKDLGLELNELTFASLILGYGRQENPPSITEMFELMKSNGVEPNGKSYTAAIVSQAQILKTNPKAKNELENTLAMLEKDDIQFNINDTVEIVSTLTPLKNDETVAKILDQVMNNVKRSINDQYRITSVLLKIGEFQEASRIYWSQMPSQNALRYGNLGTYYIRLMATYKNVPIEHAISECTKLVECGQNNKAFFHLYYYSAYNKNMDLVKAAIDKIKETDEVKCQYYWPLLAQSKDTEKLLEVLKSYFNPELRQDDLLDTFALWVWPRFADNIQGFFDLNKKELHYDSNILVASLVKYSLTENKIMDAIKFISEVSPDSVAFESEKLQETMQDESEPVVLNRRRLRGGFIGRLLAQVAEQTKDPETVERAFKICHPTDETVTTKSLTSVVKAYLLNNDFEGAMNKFMQLSKEYRATPCKRDLMIHCLENKDPENLQKIMNVSSEVHGEQNSLFDLAVCCLRCGKLKQAQKIFASPGIRVQPFRVIETCRQLAESNNVEILENFVDLARDMVDINQEQLYQVLINAYERTSNAKRVLDLWNKMQDEQFHPSKRSLLMIAKVLERNNIPVPFKKPVVNVNESISI